MNIRHLLKDEALQWSCEQLWSNGATWDTFIKALLKRFPVPMQAELDRAIQCIMEEPLAMDNSFTQLTPPPAAEGSPDTTAKIDPGQVAGGSAIYPVSSTGSSTPTEGGY